MRQAIFPLPAVPARGFPLSRRRSGWLRFALFLVFTAVSWLHAETRTPPPRWIRTELYFGIGNADAPRSGIPEAQWREFLDREVMPRFPGGFTVTDGISQWRSVDGSPPRRLRSRIITVIHDDSAPRLSDIEAIRAAWKTRTGHRSVLRISTPADVSS